ncbi:MAG: SLBB domain-containing protein [Fimbriimonadales bacterium]
MMKTMTILAGLALSVAAIANTSVSVEGAVNKPGEIRYTDGLRVREALKLAGGLTAHADQTKIELTNPDGGKRCVDLTKLGPPPLVSPGAKVSVPKLDPANYVTVKGAVAKPGVISYRDGITLTDALAQSKPYTEARTDNLKITRTDEDGKTKTIIVDLGKIQASASPMELRPGDFLEVAYPGQSSISNKDLLVLIAIGVLILIVLR